MNFKLLWLACSVLVLRVSVTLAADDPVFSGPQVGEKITGFDTQYVLGDQAKSLTSWRMPQANRCSSSLFTR